jgi:hypothetical protein
MNFDPIALLNTGASQMEPEWLTQLERTSTIASGVEPGASKHSAVAVVRVPDFLEQNHSPTRRRRSMTNQAGRVPMAVPISSDLIEKPEDWLGAKENEKEERNKKESLGGGHGHIISHVSENVDSDAIFRLTDQILNRFPLASPAVLLFAGSEWNPHVDETCAQVAYQLATRNVGKVLLVDSEFEKSELTKATRTGSQPGMAEIFNRKIHLDGCIADHDEANMDFLPVGAEPVWHWRIAAQKVPSLVKELKSRYQFACISVGDAHGEAARIWAADAEATYLVVSMAKSSQTVARSAVDQLHANGARLMGCVVSDAIEY